LNFAFCNNNKTDLTKYLSQPLCDGE